MKFQMVVPRAKKSDCSDTPWFARCYHWFDNGLKVGNTSYGSKELGGIGISTHEEVNEIAAVRRTLWGLRDQHDRHMRLQALHLLTEFRAGQIRKRLIHHHDIYWKFGDELKRLFGRTRGNDFVASNRENETIPLQDFRFTINA